MSFHDIVAARARLVEIAYRSALAAAEAAITADAETTPLPEGMGEVDADGLLLQAIAKRKGWQVDVSYGTAATQPGHVRYTFSNSPRTSVEDRLDRLEADARRGSFGLRGPLRRS